MPKFIITKTSPQVDIESVIAIIADSMEDAQQKAEHIVNEYNSLGNDHATGWTIKSIKEAVSPPKES